MSLSHDQENYIRLILLLDIGRRAVKIVFDREFDSSKLKTEIRRKGNYDILSRLKKRNVIFQPQWDVLQGDSLTSDQLDVSLMVCLLNHIAKRDIGNSLPVTSETRVDADIARIKYYRNFLAHSNDNYLSDGKFLDIWNTVCRSIKRLEAVNGELSQECDDLSAASLDIFIKDIKLIIDSISIEVTELGTELTKIKKEFKNIKNLKRDPVPPLKRVEIEKTLKKWKANDKKFIITRASNEVLQQIRKRVCVAVTGSFGAGKTAIIQNVCLAMKEKYGFYVIPIKRPAEVKKYYNPERYNLFVVDRFCGQVELNEKDVQEWSEHKLIHLNERCKLLVSCRLQIYRDKRFQVLGHFNFHECNLISSDLRPSYTEMKRIADSCNVDVDQQIIYERMPIRHYITYFPYLCELLARGDPEYFGKTFPVIETQIDMLHITGSNGKYCALALLVALNNRVDEDLLQGTISSDMKCNLENLCNKCLFSTENAADNISTELDTLVGTYVKKEGNIYRALNENMFFILLTYFEQRMFDCLIWYSHPSLIRDRFCLDDLRKNEDRFKLHLRIGNNQACSYLTRAHLWNKLGTNIILIQDADRRKLYIERMIEDWRKGYVYYVFSNPNIFHVDFFDYLEMLPESEKKDLTKTQDNEDKSTALILFCQKVGSEPPDIVEADKLISVHIHWFLRNGADVNESNLHGKTPLISSSYNGDFTMVNNLLNHGANVNQCQNNGITPLIAACESENLAVVEKLLQSGAIPDKCEKGGNSPLHFACKKGLLRITKLLINCVYGANVNISNKLGRTPLHLACMKGHIFIVCELLDHDADTDIFDITKSTPLHIASALGHLDIVRKLLENYASHKMYGAVGESALHYACVKGHLKIVQILLKLNDCGINRCDNVGQTPLFLACKKGYIDIVCELLEHKANIDLCTIHKFTPLHVASARGNLNVVTKLLEHGADFNICSDNKESALYFAFRNGHAEIVNILLQYKANVKAITL